MDLLDIIFSIKKGDSWSNFSGFQHVFLLSTSTSRFPVQNFSTVFGLDLLDIIFSIKKGDSWSNFSGFLHVFLLPLPQAGFQFRISVQFLGWIYWILFFRSRKVTVDLISQVFNMFFLLSNSTSRFPVQNFSTVFGLDLLDIIFSIKKGDSWSNFSGFQHVFLLSTSTGRFPVQNFSTVFGFDLLDIIFSIKKGDSWSNFSGFQHVFLLPLPQAGFQFRISVQFLGWIYWILYFRSRKVTVDLIS